MRNRSSTPAVYRLRPLASCCSSLRRSAAFDIFLASIELLFGAPFEVHVAALPLLVCLEVLLYLRGKRGVVRQRPFLRGRRGQYRHDERERGHQAPHIYNTTRRP